jgi:hypothetical protein
MEDSVEHQAATAAAVAPVKRKMSPEVSKEVHKKARTGVRRSKRLKKGVAVIDLVGGDPALAENVCRNYEGEPPLFFDWNDANLAAFWAKAVDYGATEGAHAPPTQVNRGAQLAGEPTQDSTKALKRWILRFISTSVGIRSRIGGPTDTFGFRCSSWANLGSALIRLGTLETFEPWFAGVVQHGIPLPGPLATLFSPSAYNSDSDFLPVSCNVAFWA